MHDGYIKILIHRKRVKKKVWFCPRRVTKERTTTRNNELAYIVESIIVLLALCVNCNYYIHPKRIRRRPTWRK